ncbi:Uncharacterized protein Fot_32822 [Forsythia ovata]|uniref:Uncharacterized protein n=1 Tax=Forsythia ovata TaxID=205694 RepID=A0ABD1T8X0_9LAMI
MAGNLKSKNVVSDESIKDVKKLSLEKLNLGRKKKLVVLCLDGLLVHRKDKNNVRRGLKPDVIHGRFRGPNGELRAFLEGLADTDHDVPTYVKEHRIGQPAITPSHPDWSSYRMILEHILTSVVRANWIDNLVEEMVSENQDSPTSGAGTSSSVPNLPSANVVADILSRLDGIFDKLTKLGESLARLESKLLQIEAHIYCHFPSPSSSIHSVP